MSERRRRAWDGADFWLGALAAGLFIWVGELIWGLLT
ncbi:hypothetical protein SEA_PHINKY_9 [Microbacterium phage Phinky]|nr:hypothetical protein SEA_PHINKY_9 [Microbacterium phage Phinky]